MKIETPELTAKLDELLEEIRGMRFDLVVLIELLKKDRG